MSIEQAINVLERHSVDCRVIGDVVQALDSWTYRDDENNVHIGSEWIDIDRDDIESFKAFLGY